MDSLAHMQGAEQEDAFEQEEEAAEGGEEGGEEGEEEVIDIDNPDELAKRGLRRIQIEGEDEEYLMDMENNIFDLGGNFIGTTDEGAGTLDFGARQNAQQEE